MFDRLMELESHPSFEPGASINSGSGNVIVSTDYCIIANIRDGEQTLMIKVDAEHGVFDGVVYDFSNDDPMKRIQYIEEYNYDEYGQYVLKLVEEIV